MKLDTLEPIGVVLTDVSLADTTAADIAEFRRLLAEHGVIVAPGQHLDDNQFVAFLGRFGTLTFTTGETPVPGFADLNVVTNVGRTSPPKSTFHTDTSYVRVPPAYTALRAVSVPANGGETLFSNQYRALDTLPDALRRRVDGRSITHVMTGIELDSDAHPDAETSADHPIVRRHPISGRSALFLSAVPRCQSISGLGDEEAQTIIRALFDHSTADSNVMRHSWSPGDIAMWDNACVLHCADHSDVVGDRVMHRGMVAGNSPSTSSGTGRESSA